MMREQEDLLVKDLCSRLPYGVIVETPKGKGHVCDINLTIFGTEVGVNISATSRDKFNIEDIKPYFFSLSSMSEEQKEFIKNQFCYDWDSNDPYSLWTYCIEIGAIDALIDLFNKYHIDYRCLISKGLANDATGLNIY